MQKNHTLSIDTSASGFAVCVLRGDAVCAMNEENRPGQQARLLVPAIDDAMARAGVRYDDLGHIVALAGPGGFTGLRIGLSAAQAIAFAAKCPAYGVGTLAAIAFAAARAGHEGALTAAADAGKQEAALQAFTLSAGNITAHAEPRLIPLAALDGQDAILAARNFQLPPQVEIRYGYAAAQLAEAAALLALHAPRWRLPPHPVYARPPDAKISGGAA